jgi:plasmid maintenance system antidote protein VapI
MQIEHNAPIEAIMQVIGENLSQQAKRMHLDQTKLAQLTGLNRNTVGAALSGQDIKLTTLIRLTRVLGFSDWLLPLLESAPPSPIEELKKITKKEKRTSHSIRSIKPVSRKIGRSRENRENPK